MKYNPPLKEEKQKNVGEILDDSQRSSISILEIEGCLNGLKGELHPIDLFLVGLGKWI